MRLFALDLHISVIADLKDILKDHEVTEWSLSGHNWVFNRPPTTPDVINQSTWQAITLEQLKHFRAKYDAFLKTFDGFLVGHVLPYVMLFEPYGKPIFAWNTCRYDLPFCFTKDTRFLDHYNESIRRMVTSGQLHMCTNNLADQAYLRAGTGLSVPRVPSLCRYTGMKYSPQKPTFFWYSSSPPPASQLITPRRGTFQWSELCTYRGIIHIPYEVSTMSLYEQYQSGIPLFIPTKRFLKELWTTGRAHWQSVSAYWGDRCPPYLRDCTSVDFWIDRADFYDTDNMPYVYYFDNIPDLLHTLESFQDVHYEERLKWIACRESSVVEHWRNVVRASLELESEKWVSTYTSL